MEKLNKYEGNCDEDFQCEHCTAENEKLGAEIFQEYKRYAIKDEDGQTVDIRDVQICKDRERNAKVYRGE